MKVKSIEVFFNPEVLNNRVDNYLRDNYKEIHSSQVFKIDYIKTQENFIGALKQEIENVLGTHNYTPDVMVTKLDSYPKDLLSFKFQTNDFWQFNPSAPTEIKKKIEEALERTFGNYNWIILEYQSWGN